MNLLLTIFTFTKILIVSEGNSFTFEQRKVIDSTGTIELSKKVKQINDTVAVQRKGNNVYYYINSHK